MNFSIFAKYSNYFFFNLDFVLENIIIAFLLFAVHGFIGYSIARLLGMNKHERISIFIAMTYVNNMLIIVFAQQFFNMQIVALSAFFNIPHYMGILILKKFVKRL